MKRSKIFLALGLVILAAAGSAQAQTRTWALSKDTLYQWEAGGVDNITVVVQPGDTQIKPFAYDNKVLITNSGAAPLYLDSLFVQRIKASFTETRVAFTIYDSSKNQIVVGQYQLGRKNYETRWNCPMVGSCAEGGSLRKFDTLAVGQSRGLYNFISDYGNPPVNKSTGVLAKNDTLVYRLIFGTRGNRGRDTLILVSRQNWEPSSLRSSILGMNPKSIDGLRYDLRGRRMENLPQGVRVPFRPVVTKQKKN